MTTTTTTTPWPTYGPRLCRSCNGTLDTIVNLGALQLTGFLAPEEEARPAAPLDFCACSSCGLVQLRHTVEPEHLFEQYWYQSGVNEVMRAELADIVDDAVARIGGVDAHSLVLDIGANDGTLLSRYAQHSPQVQRIAFEPAFNLQERLHDHADFTYAEFFPDQYHTLTAFEGRVHIITSIAMFYAVEDLARFLTAVKALLANDGVWVVQFQDLAAMLRATAFDNICHEHLIYYSLRSFRLLVQLYGLDVVDAQVRAINGGSYRLTVKHAGHWVSPRVGELLGAESGCSDWPMLERFAWRVGEVKKQIRGAVGVRMGRGQTIDLYGASTKANTLLQVCELGPLQLRQAWERSPEKIGRRTAGSDIPIVGEDQGRADPPDALLVGIWQFRDAVLRREREYLASGRSMIFPLPAVDVVSAWKETGHVHA